MNGWSGEKDMIWAAVFFVMAAGCAFAAALERDWPLVWRCTAGFAAVVFGLLGLALAMNGLRMLDRRAEYLIARTRLLETAALPEVAKVRAQIELMDRIRYMPPEALEIFRSDPELVRAIAGNLGPQPGLETGRGVVPYWFIDVFVATNRRRAPDAGLQPERLWETARNQKQYAGWLMHWMKEQGYLSKWSGPNRAFWAHEKALEEFIQAVYGERIRQVYQVEVGQEGDDDDAGYAVV